MKGRSILLGTSLLLILIASTALYAQKDSMPTGANTKSELTPEELAEPLETSLLTVRVQHVKNETSLTIYVTNNLKSEIQFGEPYDFFKLENGSWTPFPYFPIWIMPLYGLQPGGTHRQVANITGFISGRYRVTKEIQIGGVKETAGAEFIVERPPIDPNGTPKYGYYLRVIGVSEQSIYSSGPTIELYNQGGLTLTLPGEFHVYNKVDGQWVEITGSSWGFSSTLAPGGLFRESITKESIQGKSFRYVRPVYVEGYNKTVQFVFELTRP